MPTGMLVLARRSVRAVTDRQIELVTNFASQGVIAIQNVRLFDEIQDKGRQLAEASERKSQFRDGCLAVSASLACAMLLPSGLANTRCSVCRHRSRATRG